MKKILTTLALGAISIFSANAQRNISFTVGPDLAIPLGDFGDVSGIGIGGTGKLGIKVMDQGAVTLTSGYIHFMGKEYDFGLGTIEGESRGYIPIKAGFKYNFGPVYIEPQAGVGSFTKGGGTGFAYAGVLGVKASFVDLSTRYEAVSKDGTLSFVGFRLAFGI